MSVKAFLDFIELRTKVGSVIPFMAGFFFTLYYFHQIDPINTVLYFCALVLIDVFTTGWNNYNDFHLAKNETLQQSTSALGRQNIAPKVALRWLIGFISMATVLGLILVWRTNLIVLAISVLFILIGILYTYGPFPISRLPLGELLSSLVLGFGNFFLTVYVNVPADQLVDLRFDGPLMLFQLNWLNVILVFVASLPTVFLIANLMLMNNICDYTVDLENGRHTLISYIGQKRGIQLYQLSAYSCYVVIIVGIGLKLYPWPAALAFASGPTLLRNGFALQKSQEKRVVFGTAVQNLIVFNGFWLVGMLIGLYL